MAELNRCFIGNIYWPVCTSGAFIAALSIYLVRVLSAFFRRTPIRPVIAVQALLVQLSQTGQAPDIIVVAAHDPAPKLRQRQRAVFGQDLALVALQRCDVVPQPSLGLKEALPVSEVCLADW
jgi:hypothetical protein